MEPSEKARSRASTRDAVVRSRRALLVAAFGTIACSGGAPGAPPAAACLRGDAARWQLEVGDESASDACPAHPGELRLSALSREIVLEERSGRVTDALSSDRRGEIVSQTADGASCRVEISIRDDGGGRAARFRYVLTVEGDRASGELRYEDAQVVPACEDRFALVGTRTPS